MVKTLLFPDDVRAKLRRRYESGHRSWLISVGSWPLSVPLGSPTERDVRDNVTHVRSWVDAWTGWTSPGSLVWTEMQWPKIGTQRLPSHLTLCSPEEVARVVDESSRFNLAMKRYEQCAATWPALRGSSVIARYFDVLADYSDAEFERLTRLLSWLLANPSSKLFPRQLPVRGVDTKWLDGQRRGLVSDLLKAARGTLGSDDFYETCGLRRPPHRLRVRVLCSDLRRVIGGLGDIEAPVQELSKLPLSPSRVLVVENLETGLALPEIAGCVAILKLGNAVTSLADVPWIRGARVLYWGDVDTYGLAILDRARGALREVTSVLMDEATLLAHRDLWVEEQSPDLSCELPNLTGTEMALLTKLRENEWGPRVRLEQERIPWPNALAAILAHCQYAVGSDNV